MLCPRVQQPEAQEAAAGRGRGRTILIAWQTAAAVTGASLRPAQECLGDNDRDWTKCQKGGPGWCCGYSCLPPCQPQAPHMGASGALQQLGGSAAASLPLASVGGLISSLACHPGLPASFCVCRGAGAEGVPRAAAAAAHRADGRQVSTAGFRLGQARSAASGRRPAGGRWQRLAKGLVAGQRRQQANRWQRRSGGSRWIAAR